jgi:hypothetical protein
MRISILRFKFQSDPGTFRGFFSRCALRTLDRDFVVCLDLVPSFAGVCTDSKGLECLHGRLQV